MLNETCGIVINNVHTDILLQTYSNRIFLAATQYKKFGTFLTVSKESPVERFSEEVYSTKTVFGCDKVEVEAAARYIAESIKIERPLLISLSLKDYNSDVLKQIIAVVNQLKDW